MAFWYTCVVADRTDDGQYECSECRAHYFQIEAAEVCERVDRKMGFGVPDSRRGARESDGEQDS